MILNDPSVIAELTALHEKYEKALGANDAAVLDSLSWDSPRALRYGVTENLYGADEIRMFRLNRPAIDPARAVRRLEITTFGDSAGVINLEYLCLTDPERAGRQTQFWIRFAEGWKIVSAHVSLLPGPPSYLEAASLRVGLPVAASMREGVEADLGRLAAMAGLLMEFPVGQEVEPAPVFHPEQ